MSPTKSEIYYTHDNHGRPFKVEITGNDLRVFFGEWNEEIQDISYNEKTCFEFENFKELFVGYSPFNSMTSFSGGFGDDFLGNSILVNTKENDYVFIGHQIIQFQIDEPILDFVSPVGNNDVPYPYIETESKVYCILEETIVLKDGMEEFLNGLSLKSKYRFNKCISVPNTDSKLLDPYSCYVYGHFLEKLTEAEQECFKTFIKMEPMTDIITIRERA